MECGASYIDTVRYGSESSVACNTYKIPLTTSSPKFNGIGRRFLNDRHILTQVLVHLLPSLGLKLPPWTTAPVTPASLPNTSQDILKMKINMLLVTVVLMAAPALAKAMVRPSSNQLFRKDSKGDVINTPLTDHTKNGGKTDLQWYAKVSVGTPPQEL